MLLCAHGFADLHHQHQFAFLTPIKSAHPMRRETEAIQPDSGN